MKKSGRDNIFEKLEGLRLRYKELQIGHRRERYTLLGEATVLAMKIKTDEAATALLYKKVPDIKKKNVIFACVALVTGGKGKNRRKQVSKDAAALTYLVDVLEVDVDEVVDSITENGGIEKLARLAAAQRQNNKRKLRTASKLGNSVMTVKCSSVQRLTGKKPTSDVEVVMAPSVEFDRRVQKWSSGTKIKMIGTLGQDDASAMRVEVDRVVRLKSVPDRGKPNSAEVRDKRDEWD
jgi:hypothetical protein